MTASSERPPAAAAPLVTVVTPSYNQAAYLEHTLQSVLCQDYPDLEYLVVDGGSTDGSVEVIRRHEADLAWWVSEPDGGQAQALNKGLSRAQGEFVAWLNSDDLYLPGAVRQAVQALQANPGVSMVYGDAITIDPQGRMIGRFAFQDWGLRDLAAFRIICQPAVMMRRSFLEKMYRSDGFFLDEAYHFMLDHHLWLRLAAQAPVQHVGGATGVWAAARAHPAAKNVTSAAGFATEILRLKEWLLNRQPGHESSEMDNICQSASERRRIAGGAYRLAARYLLDGGQPGQALHWYLKAFVLRPAYTLQHAHRILYALLSLLGAGGVAASYYRARQGQRAGLALPAGVTTWPGLSLHSGTGEMEVAPLSEAGRAAGV